MNGNGTTLRRTRHLQAIVSCVTFWLECTTLSEVSTSWSTPHNERTTDVKPCLCNLLFMVVFIMKEKINTLVRTFITEMKRKLPTGVFFDDVLNFIHAWNRLGYMPHVSSPRSFNEHILSSKRYFRGDIDLARRITDKFLFKEWLTENGYGDLIIPTLGVFQGVESIRYSTFRQDTILKPTHLSGNVVIVRTPRKLTANEVTQMEQWLETDFYKKSREQSYRGIVKRIIYEPLFLDSNSNIPMDFKFFCVLGKPFMVQVDSNRFTNHTRQLYSTEWELLDFGVRFPRNPQALDKPECLTDALDIASDLSQDFPFCRVDLYLLPNKLIKVGEITFFPESGAGRFSPESADFSMGETLQTLFERGERQPRHRQTTVE